ncbi:MAG: SRPBCC family protein [Bacteroidota bacterium]|nr:SRPBCC family protein [Bacteroidota bacterium]
MKKINQDIKCASTLPGDFYSSDLIFKDVLNKIFATSWQFISDDSLIQNNKDAYPFNFLDPVISEPLFFINNNNHIDCFSNVCTHRGNILLDKPCKISSKIVCNYHGRTFDRCGNFFSMPETTGMRDFPGKEDNLTSIPTQSWRQFLFTSLDPLFPFNDYIMPIEERIGWMPIEEFKFRSDLSQEYVINANWALYCDNYLEGFHIPFVHQDLSETLDYFNYDVELFKLTNLQIGIGKDDDDCFILPKESQDYGRKIAAYYFFVFPNLMLNFYPWGLSINIVKPISKTQTKIIFKSYVWDEKKLKIGAGADINKVELEDEEIVQRVQKGVSSRYYKKGRFSPKMEQGVHHFHSLISKIY